MNLQTAKSEEKRGSVALVGAGPGDPKLLTLRGAELLAAADVVVYDYLANPKLLAHCRESVERIYVGKKASTHTMTQAEINALLIELSRAGKSVVRLKGGDPYVFGRGGEEGEALHDAGISFEVVPGITAAIAAPTYAGIPVTHRDFNSSFTFITGHEKEAEYRDDESKARDRATGSSDIDWNVIAKLPAIAFYMGAKSLPRICKNLIEHGMNSETPAATIQWGTHAKQRSVAGTVATIAEVVERARISSPAITIIGRVVSMRDKLNWFETRPLFGKTILVTRTRQHASELSERLELLGATVLEAPTIEIAAPTDFSSVDAALRKIAEGKYDWLSLTSANAAIALRERLLKLGLDARSLASIKIAAIGEATAKEIERSLFMKVDFQPQRFVAESLVEEFADANEIRGKRHLVLRADIGRPLLIERLRELGAAIVDDVAIYETRSVESLPVEIIAAIDDGRVDWITFTSSSTATNLCRLLGEGFESRLKAIRLASIGPVTSQTIRELGLNLTVEASRHDLGGLVEAVVSVESEG